MAIAHRREAITGWSTSAALSDGGCSGISRVSSPSSGTKPYTASRFASFFTSRAIVWCLLPKPDTRRLQNLAQKAVRRLAKRERIERDAPSLVREDVRCACTA